MQKKTASILIAVMTLLSMSGLLIKKELNKVPNNTADLTEWKASAVAEQDKMETVDSGPEEMNVPVVKVLDNNYHVFQTFNNCGPAALSMALSYYGINVSQNELGELLRPYQNQQGNNDDKSVTLAEMAGKAEEYGLITYHRPVGNMDLVRKFISRGIPVVVRTWLHDGEDIGHFRVIKGYNNQKGQILQDDSYQGKNLSYSFTEFDKLWRAFNHEYLVIVPEDKKELAVRILGEDANEAVAWNKAVSESENALKNNPQSIYDRFNLSVAKYNLGDYQGSVSEYEKVADRLPGRMLWYQIEPILAYYRLENYGKVFEMTDNILNNQNRAFSELYQLRGKIYMKQGKEALAESEFRKAIQYNKNFKLDDSERALIN